MPPTSTDASVHPHALAKTILWRALALLAWAWVIGWFAIPEIALVPFGLGQRLGAAVALMLGALLYTLLDGDGVFSFFKFAIGFPFYFAFAPLWVPLVFAVNIIGFLQATVSRSQKVLWSLLPYALTACAIWVATTFQFQWSAWLGLILLGVSTYFVVISLATWIFDPLPWASAYLQWVTTFSLKNARDKNLPSTDSLRSGDNAARTSFKNAIVAIASGQSSLDKTPAGLTPLYRDAFLASSFARKYFFTLAHTALLFAIVHFLINRASPAIGPFPAFSNLPRGTLLETWPHYLYFSSMTLASGDTEAIPITAAAKIATIANAYAGIAFLVLLITIFSMVTKDRARTALQGALGKTIAARRELEEMGLAAVQLAFESNLLQPDILSELSKITFLHVDPSRARVAQGIILSQKVIADVELWGEPGVLAPLLEGRRTMSPEAFAAFYESASSVKYSYVRDLAPVLLTASTHAVPPPTTPDAP